MKKKIISIIGVVTFAVAVAFNINAGLSNGTDIDIMLANVEALGQGENGCQNTPGSNDGHCETNGTVYLCAKDGWFERKDCVKGADF